PAPPVCSRLSLHDALPISVRVRAGVRGAAVGVQDGNDPEVDPRRRHPGEAGGDRDPARLVAVDAADDEDARARRVADLDRTDRPDRKSTRLNSSHQIISYA